MVEAVSLGWTSYQNTPLLALEFPAFLKWFADHDVADGILLVMKPGQFGLGFFFGAVYQLGELEAAFAVEFVLDDVLGRLSHGHAYLLEWAGRLS